jgi:hypothetical protein
VSDPTHPLFWQKSPQALEKKESGCGKERQERKEAASHWKHVACGPRTWPVKTDNRSPKIPGGNSDRCENKGVAEKAIQKLMKIKG